MQSVVVVEKGEKGYGAYAPDLPGCVAVAETRVDVLNLIQEAIEFHIEGLQMQGILTPEPSSFSEYIEVLAA